MIFKIYDADFGIKIDGVNYEFEHVENMSIEDPEFTRLVRGKNAGNKLGLAYKEGLAEPKRITVTIKNMSIELKAVLDAAFEDKSRMDVFCIARGDGSSKMAKNSVLCQQPQQLQVDETPESMDVALIFESFDLSEVHKE
jgi:hypothetical protein